MAKSKKYFDEVNPQVDFPQMERDLVAHWYKSGVVQKYLHKNAKSKNYFSFQDGPITANNPMGVHHAWGRTYKDLWQRYNNLKGRRQRFQNGFDCQGLWVEVEVEKELGLKDKKEIENLVPGDKKKSIAKFVELCKKRVYKYAEIQTEQSKRLGYFMDWDHSYYTLSEENNYMIWHFLKKCFDRGLIYKGRDSVPWCPRCGTAISQHEMLTEDYKELTHETVFFKLPVKGHNFSMLAWTTTPWTIPGNVALAVNPKFKYIIWNTKDGDKVATVDPKEIADSESQEWFKKYVLDEGLKEERSIKGNDLVGLAYEAPFDFLDKVKNGVKENPRTFHTIIPAEDLVVATKGTGILHVAPGAGEEDFKLGKEFHLSVINLIDEEANYYSEMGEFSGKNAKKHPELIIDFLKSKGKQFLFKTSPITHRYPACWRCKTELVWRVVDEWYIAMDHGKPALRESMKDVAKKIKWIPPFGLERELDWLDNMHDWLISKKRYWGLALPIWECSKCGNFEVVGGKEELKEKAVEGWKQFEGHTPHKPFIDEIKIKCAKCGGTMERIPDVGNPWLDAGIVPYSTISKDNESKPLYLADKKEWEKWFPVDFITESFPGQFKNWFYSMIAMSTVLTNREPFKTVLGFGTLLDEKGLAMHKSWGNAIEFNEGADSMGVDVMRWMYMRQNPAENMLFGYRLADEVRRQFILKIWNVYNYFVRYANLSGHKPSKKALSKNILDRWIISRLNETINKVGEDLDKYDPQQASLALESFVDDFSNWYIRRSRGRDDKEFFDTTHQVLVNLMILLAPFVPFISDTIYTNLTKEESVHLADWPVAGKVDRNLIKEMLDIRKTVVNAHAERKSLNLPVRQPLSLLVTTAPFTIKDKALYGLVCDEVNIKNWKLKKGNELSSKFDTKITPELEEEAKTRELIRKIQEQRKVLEVSFDEKVIVTSEWLPQDKDLLAEISKRTLAASLKNGEFSVKRT